VTDAEDYAVLVNAFRITVDAESGTALNEQLTTQIQDAVKAGALAAGTKLPTVRSLATELGVAPYTVARAYRQLEDLGVIETHGRNGTIVSTFGDTTQQQAQVAARAFADRIHSLGVSSDEALALAKSALGNA
jgi:DNA-binding transcriptional regulator YhcF (GntR family)